ncbi:Mini-ribonuclease 3 [Alkalibacter rhizosphaerae]|uniref:Mini-ribonuclease 3 n=1 Tax=Alkalibacter rhizosphaerae TaxID=2815577 RepID=A0A975AH63_9FIRM|nr:ribonuclease III domain-containing protein [Alkalibacter rhizosphaerae]QSX08122.1 Mini-ribonuclease 3 [Alkalibacter rhizosphaerae]
MEKNQIDQRPFFPEGLNRREAKSFNPVSLAFMGDAIYESHVRRYVVLHHPRMKSGDLHRICIRYVKATAQSMAVGVLRSEFTEDENMIFRRGRNASSPSPPKNTPIVDYKRSTGLEAVFGYLFLTGDLNRLEELIEKTVRIIEGLK